jgi:fatty acid desaturase
MKTKDSEAKIESFLRKLPWAIPVITFSVAILLMLCIYGCMMIFIKGYYGIVMISGLLYHSVMIITVHDGAHKSITQSRLDSAIIAFFGGVLLIPFYPEPFRKYHLMHHADTNGESDPLWPELKKKLFLYNRFLYVLAELFPFGFLAVSLFSNKKEKKSFKSININFLWMGFSFVISLITYYLLQPNLWFLGISVFMGLLVAKFRHWCEHIGTSAEKESNTYWFPLGMGIGNHEIHHKHPNYSWISLSLGLYKREKYTNPIKAFFQILFNQNLTHYKKTDEN